MKGATDFRIGKLFIPFLIEGLPFSSFYKKNWEKRNGLLQTFTNKWQVAVQINKPKEKEGGRVIDHHLQQLLEFRSKNVPFSDDCHANFVLDQNVSSPILSSFLPPAQSLQT